MLNLFHHDRASLLAGKLHAVLSRPWVRGRELYDLLWYLSDPSWPAPNLEMLSAALAQSGWTGPAVTADNWRGVVQTRLASVNWKQATGDMQPFLERQAELALLTRETFSRLLERRP